MDADQLHVIAQTCFLHCKARAVIIPTLPCSKDNRSSSKCVLQILDCDYGDDGASLVAQMVKNLPAMQETRVQSLAWEDPLKKGMSTHSSVLARRIPWIEEPGGLQFTGPQRIGHD